jgi:hypothetical protein
LIVAIVVSGLIVKREVAVMVLNYFDSAVDSLAVVISPYGIINGAATATSPNTGEPGVVNFAVFRGANIGRQVARRLNYFINLGSYIGNFCSFVDGIIDGSRFGGASA